MSVIQLSANHVYAVAIGVTKLLKTPKIVNQHYEPGADWFAWSKLLESLIYQCDGDTTGGDHVIKALALLLADVKLWIFNHLDIYDRAPWLI